MNTFFLCQVRKKGEILTFRPYCVKIYEVNAKFSIDEKSFLSILILNQKSDVSKFPSLVFWYTVIHHHRPQGPTLFLRVRWDFTCVQCNVCKDTGPVLCPI